MKTIKNYTRSDKKFDLEVGVRTRNNRDFITRLIDENGESYDKFISFDRYGDKAKQIAIKLRNESFRKFLKKKFDNDLDYSLEHTIERIRPLIEDVNYHSPNKTKYGTFYVNEKSDIKPRYASRLFGKRIQNILHDEERRRIVIHEALHESEFKTIDHIYNNMIKFDKFIDGTILTIKENTIYYNGYELEYINTNAFIKYPEYVLMVLFSPKINRYLKIKIDYKQYEFIKHENSFSLYLKHSGLSVKTIKDNKSIMLFKVLYPNSDLINYASYKNDYVDLTLDGVKNYFNEYYLNSDKYIYRKTDNTNSYIFIIKHKKYKFYKGSINKSKLIGIKSKYLSKIFEQEIEL